MAKIVKKSYRLSIYLLKANIENYRDALKKEISIVAELEFKDEIKTEGAVIIGATKQCPSSWKDLIQEGVDTPLPDLENASNRAIAFFKIEDRIFALVFGYGIHLIKEESIDRDFGLRTVLNIINPDKLLSIDKANLDDLTVLTKTQTSRTSNPEAFSIDIIKDLLRGITGEPTPEFNISFGKVITGSEGIYFVPKVNFKDIPNSLIELKKAYEGDKYKSRFGWIDNLRHERDPELIEHLQKCLVEDLHDKNNIKIHLAPPYLIDWESFEGFSYTPKGEIQTDFEIGNFYVTREDFLEDITWDKLLGASLYFKYADDDDLSSFPLWRCINYQTEYKDNIYVFALSKWYKVNKTYADELIDFVKQIEESDLDFIDCEKRQNEGEYNIELARYRSYYHLLDKKLIKTDLTRSKIELCDVLSDSMEFIHVKFRNSSATLSHLFAQGKISAYALRKDKAFRKNVRKKLHDIGMNKDLIPIESKDFNANDYTITFALIEANKRSFVESLPFFSLLNFRLTADDLLLLGYKVKVKKIGII